MLIGGCGDMEEEGCSGSARRRGIQRRFAGWFRDAWLAGVAARQLGDDLVRGDSRESWSAGKSRKAGVKNWHDDTAAVGRLHDYQRQHGYHELATSCYISAADVKTQNIHEISQMLTVMESHPASTAVPSAAQVTERRSRGPERLSANESAKARQRFLRCVWTTSPIPRCTRNDDRDFAEKRNFCCSTAACSPYPEHLVLRHSVGRAVRPLAEGF